MSGGDGACRYSWYDAAEPTNRRHALVLERGNLYEFSRADPGAVWSPPHLVSDLVSFSDARAVAAERGLNYLYDEPVAS